MAQEFGALGQLHFDHSACKFKQAGLPEPEINSYRLEGELEDLLARSFPNEGDADRFRKIFVDSIATDALDLNTRREKGTIYYSFPVAILVAKNL